MPDRPGCLPRERLDRPFADFAAPALSGTVGVCTTEAEAIALAQLAPDAIVALSPLASCELRIRSIDHLAIEDLFDVRALLEADEPMLALQRGWIDAVDDFCRAENPIIGRSGVAPAGDWSFWLKGVSDRLYRAAFGVAHLLLAARGAKILSFETAGDRRPAPNLAPDRQPYAETLAALAPVYDIDVELLDDPSSRRTRAPDTLKQRLPAAALDVARLVRDHGIGGLLPAPTGAVIHAGSYDVAALVTELRRRGVATRPLAAMLSDRAPRRPPCGHAELGAALRTQPFFAEAFTWCGANLTPAASPALDVWWDEVVPALLACTRRAQRRFRRRRPRALVVFSAVGVRDHAALAAARRLAIPTVTYQHGGFEGNCEYTTYDIADMRLAEHRLTYGEGVTSYLEQRRRSAPEPQAELHTVGSGRLDRIGSTAGGSAVRERLGIASDEPIVCYLPGGYQHRSWYLCRGAYLGTPYLRLLADVAERFRAHRDVHVVYKPFPETPLDPAVRLLERIPNVTIVRDIRPPDLFATADACVLDIPSTALLEAMLTARPLLVHSDARFITLRAEAREALRRRATLTETPDELLQKLDALLTDPRHGNAPTLDRTFLRRYGTHLDDRRSATRAADAVLAIADRH